MLRDVSQGTALYLLSGGIVVLVIGHRIVDRTWLPSTWRRYWLAQAALYGSIAILCTGAMTIAFNVWIGVLVAAALVGAFLSRVITTLRRREHDRPQWADR